MRNQIATGRQSCLLIMLELDMPLTTNMIEMVIMEIANAVNNGKLVLENVIFGLLSERLEAGYYRGECGFILNGIPRSVRQAQECTPGAIQMKLETSIENRMWAARMTKHVMEMNKHLQSRLLDLMQNRLFLSADSTTPRKRKSR